MPSDSQAFFRGCGFTRDREGSVCMVFNPCREPQRGAAPSLLAMMAEGKLLRALRPGGAGSAEVAHGEHLDPGSQQSVRQALRRSLDRVLPIQDGQPAPQMPPTVA